MQDYIWFYVILLMKIVVLFAGVLLSVAYYTYFERKIIGYMQCRYGPNRVGPYGLLQPMADGLKLLFKEIILPTKAFNFYHLIAPILAFVPAFGAWIFIPFAPNVVLSDVDSGILMLFAISSMGIYGIILAGWSSNSQYATLGALRAAAQVVSYEIALSFTILGVVMASGSLNLQQIVLQQSGGIWNWYFLPLFPLFIIFWISALAETNRAPFDLAEGESEIVAGFHVEYSGMGFALFMITEYANMILMSVLASLLFFGGWLSPFEGIKFLYWIDYFIPSFVWLMLKTLFFMFSYLWIRATFPRYRYDQLMQIGWKVLIPITLFWIILEAIVLRWLAMM